MSKEAVAAVGASSALFSGRLLVLQRDFEAPVVGPPWVGSQALEAAATVRPTRGGVALLAIGDDTEDPLHVNLWSGQERREQQRHLGKRQLERFFEVVLSTGKSNGTFGVPLFHC
jgi:hypothetical protein